MSDLSTVISVGCTVVVSAVAIGRSVMARGAADERQRQTEIKLESLEKKTTTDRAELVQMLDSSNRARVEQIERLEGKLERFSSDFDAKFERARNESSQHHVMLQAEIKAISQMLRDLEISTAKATVIDARTEPSWPGLRK